MLPSTLSLNGDSERPPGLRRGDPNPTCAHFNLMCSACPLDPLACMYLEGQRSDQARTGSISFCSIRQFIEASSSVDRPHMFLLDSTPFAVYNVYKL